MGRRVGWLRRQRWPGQGQELTGARLCFWPSPPGPGGSVSTNEDLVQTFTELDLNADGQITMKAFTVAMTARGEKITKAEIESIFADADTDKDGRISLSEFTTAWNSAEVR